MTALQRALASPGVSLSEQDVLAVAIYRPNPSATPPQYHVGIVYRDPDDNHPYFLHLAWHNRLRRDDYEEAPKAGQHLWISPPFDEIDLSNMVSVCRNVWMANRDGKIPYGFSDYSEFFDPQTLRKVERPDTVGLTCATFVLAAFKQSLIDLIKPETWAVRPDDQDWREQILHALLESNVDQDHVDLVATQIANLRYRPTDVAAASLTPEPSEMSDLAQAITAIEATIDGLRGTP